MRKMSSHHPVRAAAALSAAVGAALLVAPVSASAVTTAVPVVRGGCDLPLVHDIYDGFHVGVPSGWDLSTMEGEVSVDPSPNSPEGVILYPVLLTRGTTVAQVFAAYMAYEQRNAEAAGSVFSYQVARSHGGLPSATVRAEVDGVSLAGEATATLLPLKTQMASDEAVVSLAVAPRNSFASDAPLLAGIARCYGPEQAQLFAVFPTNPYTYIMPPGFSPIADQPNALEIANAANTGSATYDLWGPLVQGVNVSQPLTTPAEAITYWLGQLGISGVTTLSAVTKDQVEYMEFTGTTQGYPVHGLMYMDLSVTGPSAAGVFRLALAVSSYWDSLNGALIEMAGSIQHDFTQDLQDIQEVNREWQDFSGQVADFDDTLNDQQLVQDPNTGKFYEAPYSSWQDGPQGWGYYGPQDQLLNPVQRP
ncbi:MAG TPA: hypothetical protein VME46_03950 [Acidimicrobiales bacterium]|nr:hypothetical protein [Acidimicrobiales bacterium]